MDEPSPETDAAPEAPTHPAVSAMRAALDRGDHHEARRLAQKLAGDEDPALRAAGAEMLSRFAFDPRVAAVFAVTTLLVLFLAVHWMGHR